MAEVNLTEEQLGVVAHSHGPALVYAVAGAGKTTAMVHRIERLVRESVFSAKRILATSFNRDAVQELERRLQTWSYCAGVKCMTLHGLGWRILKAACNRGILPAEIQLPSDDQAATQIFWQTLKRARMNPREYPQLDNLDKDDFLDYVGRCKGNLCYAELNAVHLPEEAKAWASQAEAPELLPHYLKLYQLFEQVRRQNYVMTFDDLLIEAWELLWRYPELRRLFQNQFDCILVDEFQDVNLAQSEILDLLASSHGNFMVIGDDDQTIYEWRGASPRFILGFETRYQATRYTLSDNFRCTASQVVLANGVIRQNQNRMPKQLHLTQGFGGMTSFQHCNDGQEMSTVLVQTLQARNSEGLPFTQMAVLVRSWAQTPMIEHQLLQAGIPYFLPKDKHFYRRPEIRDFLGYVRLAQLDTRLADGQGLPSEEMKVLTDTWRRLQNRPGRYISNECSQAVMREVLTGRLTLQNALRLVAVGSSEYLSENLNHFADILAFLTQAWLELAPAESTLRSLEKQLGWCSWLAKNSAFVDAGKEKAESVMAFLDFARTQDNLPALLAELVRLSQNQLDTQRLNRNNAVLLTTLHSAKGLEWDLVILPGCNEGIFPGRQATPEEVEAERRLLYVGLTRSRRELYLLASRPLAISSFLTTARMKDRLLQVQELEALLEQAPESWRWSDFSNFLSRIEELELARYFEHWAPLPEELERRLTGWIAWQREMRPEHILPDSSRIWVTDQSASELLAENELFQLEELYGHQKPLWAGEVRHPRFGTGKVLKRISTEHSRMVVIDFRHSGKVQMPLTDRDLEWGPVNELP